MKSILSVLSVSALLSFGTGVAAVPFGGYNEFPIPCGWNDTGEPTSESCTVDDSGFVSCKNPEDCFDEEEPINS